MESGMPESPGKSRADKLDEALLSLISLTSIIFTIIQAFSGGITFVLYSTLLLIFGVVAPFYYGYWKGALEDSAIMRVRGWIYLFSGTLGYATFVTYLNAMTNRNPLTGVAAIILYLLFSYLLIRIRHEFLYHIFKICNKEVSSFDIEVADATTTTSLSFLAFLISCVVLLQNQGLFSSPPFSAERIAVLVFFFTSLSSLPFGVLGELNSRRILKSYERRCCELVHWKFLERHRRFTEILSLSSSFLFLILLFILFSILIYPEVETGFLIYIFCISYTITLDLTFLVPLLSHRRRVYKRKVALKQQLSPWAQHFYFSLRNNSQ
jgi:hypothetical protein